MKILFIDFTLPYLLKDADYPVGGWAVQLFAWLKGLVWCGEEVAVLTWKGGEKYCGKQDFKLLDTYNPDKGIKFLRYVHSFMPSLLKSVKAYKPDIIIQACSGLNTGSMAFIAEILGVPFVYRMTNDVDVDERYKTRLQLYQRLAYRYGLNKADTILCQNQYQYDCLRKRFSKKTLHILSNPFDVDKTLSSIVARKEKKYIAWIGVFSSQKNMAFLLRIAEKLTNIEFRIAGKPSENMDMITQKSIFKLNTLKNVCFVGYVSRKKILNFLSKAVALLSTSHYEGFSNTFLESLAAGTPIVAPRRVDPNLFITNNNLGLTSINDKDLTCLVQKIWYIDDKEYEKYTKRCRKYVIEYHDYKKKALELVKILKPITSSIKK